MSGRQTRVDRSSFSAAIIRIAFHHQEGSFCCCWNAITIYPSPNELDKSRPNRLHNPADNNKNTVYVVHLKKPTLQNMWIRKSKEFTEIGCRKLLMQQKKLRVLHLWHCDVRPEDLAKLKKVSPHCKIDLS